VECAIVSIKIVVWGDIMRVTRSMCCQGLDGEKEGCGRAGRKERMGTVSYTHLRAHET